MKIFRSIRLERLAAKLILFGTVGLLIGLFGGSPSIMANFQVQSENDGVGVRQKKIYDAILLASEPDSDPGKAARLQEMKDESWSFYDIDAVKAPAAWQWALTVLSGLIILTGQALNALGSLRLKAANHTPRRSRPSAYRAEGGAPSRRPGAEKGD